MENLSIGISTCPNDTFLFHALLEKRIQTPGLSLQFELLDIQQLNQRLRAGLLDVGKVSFALLRQLSPEYSVLPVGAALGFGVGPILVGRCGAAQAAFIQPDARARILCPGRDTTACLLFRSFFPQCTNIEHCVFSEIMPAIAEGRADYGVLIHEGRFTFEQQNLTLVADLGQLWEERYHLPLPLGGLVARNRLRLELRVRLIDCLRESLHFAHSHPEEAILSMRRYAQEFSDEVLWQHVKLYVNEHTLEMGEEGVRALELLCGLGGL